MSRIEDYRDGVYTGLALTRKGDDWLAENSERFELERTKLPADDEIPF